MWRPRYSHVSEIQFFFFLQVVHREGERDRAAALTALPGEADDALLSAAVDHSAKRTKVIQDAHFSHMSDPDFATSQDFIADPPPLKSPTPLFPICGDPISSICQKSLFVFLAYPFFPYVATPFLPFVRNQLFFFLLANPFFAYVATPFLPHVRNPIRRMSKKAV